MPSVAAIVLLVVFAPIAAIWGVVRYFGSHVWVREIQRHRVESARVAGDRIETVRDGKPESTPLASLLRGESRYVTYIGFSTEAGSGMLVTLPRRDDGELRIGIPRHTVDVDDALVKPLVEAKLLGPPRPCIGQLWYPTLRNLVELAATGLWVTLLYRLVA